MTINKTTRLIVNQGSYATYHIITCNQYSSAHNISTYYSCIKSLLNSKIERGLKGKHKYLSYKH